jgi:PAS domain S-box-containing protein
MKLTISKKISFLLLLMVIIAVANILIIYYYQNLQKFDSHIVNMAGRQRMLSEKISKLALSVANGNDGDRQLLIDAIWLYDSSLKILRHGGRVNGDILPPAPVTMKDLFDENKDIWDLFKENAEVIANETRYNLILLEAISFVEANDDLLLEKINDVVSAYESLPNAKEFTHEINVVGRERMLSQKISKYAHMMVIKGDVETRKKLQMAAELFEKSLITLSNGGISIPWGKPLKVPPSLVKTSFAHLKDIWKAFKLKLDVIQKTSRDNRIFRKSIDYIRQNDGELLAVSDKVTVMFDQIFSEKVIRLRALLIIMLVFDILIFLTGNIMAGRIARPIKALSKFARRIGKGDFTQKIDIPGFKDETGDLANAFNKMIEDLQKTTVSKNYVDNILKSMSSSLVVVNPDATMKTVNEATCHILGYKEKELVDKPVSTIIPRAGELFEGMGMDLIKHGFVHNVENIYVSKEGHEIPVLLSGSVISDNNGEVEGVIFGAVEITYRKEAEKKLRNLSKAMEQSPASVILTDAMGKIEFVNPKFTEISGYSKEEVFGKNPSLLKSGKQSSAVYKKLWETITSGKEWRGELQNKKKNGELFWEFTSISGIEDENGKVTHFLAIKEDITERKRMEKVIHYKSELINLMQEITITSNHAATVEEALHICLYKVCNYMGWPIGHVYMPNSAGKLIPSKLWHIENPQQFGIFRKITETTPFDQGIGLPGRVLASGKAAWITDVTKDPNFPRAKLAKNIGIKAGLALPVLEGKKVVAVLEFFSEEAIEPDEPSLEALSNLATQLGRVTERKRARERMEELNSSLKKYASEMEHLAEERAKHLVHADRLVSIGTLAAGVAHEINNPVGFISYNLQVFEKLWSRSIKVCIEKVEAGNSDKNLSFALDEMPKMVKSMREGTKRISTIVRKLSTFSRVKEEAFEETSISGCINNAIAFCSFGSTMKYKIDIQVNIPEDVPNITINRSEIEQVFVNLFNNAAHSMEGIIDDRKPILKISAVYTKNEIVIETTDNGNGINKKDLDSIFNPFFTTKEVGKGTGLGLSICYGIIKSHRGTIKVNSELNEGTTFTITLPVDFHKMERRKKDEKISGCLRKEDELISA